uniref:Inosine/uridine-preferring nucleoside hydrolase domain-containing protein n=1 Tax=Hemiselmis andersenii TaxID=464988 RepID=A0A6T8I448_HEMAN|mmetsp:Transcript_41110/g.100274  ORF Transcript_41110/g.100274 Transcript_41110/m.100274 type:complete len:698 (+) Transcript_41110:67-2160(+)
MAPTPILFVTDIGRDIDDTVALLALSTYEKEGKVKLVGVIATGGVGEDRARLTRFWLRRLGYGDGDVPVAACLANGKDVCLMPEANPGVPTVEEANLFRGSSPERAAPELCLALADMYKGRLEVIVIGPMSAIGDAVRSDEDAARMQRGVAKMHIQGQATVGADGRLAPDFIAFNLGENRESSTLAFDKLQDHMPFHLLGKHAAYRVTLTPGDFKKFDDAADSNILQDQAEKGLASFRLNMPEIFYRLYPVPEDQRGDDQWYKTLSYVSHPYDPTLTIATQCPSLFTPIKVDHPNGKGSHLLIGMKNEGNCEVPDETLVHKEILRTVQEAGKVMAMAMATEAASEPIPFLFVTDIGRDIDDTVALLALAAYEREGKIKLVGVVATGGAGVQRARLTRYWLRRLGYRDEDVPVAACLADGKPVCLLPDGVPSEEDACLFRGESEGRAAAELCLALADLHQGRLNVLVIGPASALGEAVSKEGDAERLRRGIARMHIQGQATVGAEGRLEPDFAAFNLSENKEAATVVFDKLQDHMPFVLLGKHAAYRVTLTREDFMAWDVAAGTNTITEQANKGLAAFRKDMPDVFYRVYPVPEDKRGDDVWFKTLTYISHPYDPLLTVAANHNDLFQPVRVPNPKLPGSAKEHLLIGMKNEGDCQVPDAEAAHAEICRVVKDSSKRMASIEMEAMKQAMKKKKSGHP